jgi:NAD(P)-dependent dehydrogenase (short-subunit alcohol dehydrogenase family)
MKGQIALVTGANTGVGYEVVRALARKGMTVYLGSRDEQKGRKAVDELAHEGDIRLATVDVTDEQSMQAIVDRTAKEHGRLDSLVNNAGIAFEDTVLTAKPHLIRESMEANLHGPMRLAILALDLLRKSKQARIVNVSSRTSLIRWMQSPDSRSSPDSIPYSYSLAKAAQNAATIMLANALRAEGIKVNAATPGYVKSQLSRFIGTKSPADGARIIVDLATLGPDGPTCGFFEDTGPLDWC